MTNDMRAWQDPSDGWTRPEKTMKFTRPVVVVDPTDDRQIRAIVGAWSREGNLAAALRSLLTPPKVKPDEPDEHGAKVIDKGVQYVASERRELGDHRGLWFWTADNGAHRSWGQFSDDVEVVS